MSIKVYCGAHGSNLVMKACCHSSVPAVNIYGTDAKPGELQKLCLFLYGNARKRNQIFQENKKKCTKRSAQIAHFTPLSWQAHIQSDSYHFMMLQIEF
jgi:hypothetical protein